MSEEHPVQVKNEELNKRINRRVGDLCCVARSALAPFLLCAAIMRLVVRARALRDRARLPLQSAALEALDERLLQRARGDGGARSCAFL